MFFDRAEACMDLWRLLGQGRSILVLAPRRVGKTELLHALLEQSDQRGFHSVLLDMEGYGSETEVLHQLCNRLHEETGLGRSLLTTASQRMKQFLGGADSEDWRHLLVKAGWRDFSEHLLATLNKDSDRPWVILVDELPVFLLGLLKAGQRDRAELFLHWLRNIRQRLPNVRWVFAGSIGLDAVTRREALEGTLVGLEVYPLGPFNRPTAAAFLLELGRLRDRPRTFAPEAVEVLLDGIGWLSPYYLEKAAEAAFSQADAAITPTMAEQALDRLLDLPHKTYWSTWRDHLVKNFQEPERTHLFAILEALALHGPLEEDALLSHLNAGGAVLDARTFRSLLDTLDLDGYLDRKPLRFRMDLLRRWWRAYVV